VSNGTPSLRITETSSIHDNHRTNWDLLLSQGWWTTAASGCSPSGTRRPAVGSLAAVPTVVDDFNATLIPELGRDPTFANPCVQWYRPLAAGRRGRTGRRLRARLTDRAGAGQPRSVI
jgi:hypothetical protein